MQSCVASSGWDHPYLMHMVLAISCAHQRHVGHSASLLAEATHWENGLQLHRKNLTTMKPGQSIDQWDALVATTFLSIMYTFSMHEEGLEGTTLSDEHGLEHFFTPLETTGGFRSLFHLFPRDNNAQSSWLPILYGTDDSAGTFTSEAPGIEGLPEPFVKLCEMDETSTSHNNPYHKIVRGLAPLLCLEPAPSNFATLFAFLGRTWPSLKPLVYIRDPRGLLLLSYWLALLQQVDQWWLTKKARAACGAIIAFLSRVQDPEIDELMAFPSVFEDGNVDEMWYQLRLVSS
ncbi:unnamed protein product [Cercospora beticola]|nr:unnamed protein product [Cercospora beticola]